MADELRDCWPRHIHAVWELSTLAAEWHHAYGGTRPDLARALEFYDRWLPGTMRRISGITGKCIPHCVMLRGSPASAPYQSAVGSPGWRAGRQA
jgi:hypothetical protein